MKVCFFVFVLNFHSLKIVCAQALQHVVSHESLLNKHLGHRPKKFGNHWFSVIQFRLLHGIISFAKCIKYIIELRQCQFCHQRKF